MGAHIEQTSGEQGMLSGAIGQRRSSTRVGVLDVGSSKRRNILSSSFPDFRTFRRAIGL